MDQNPVLDMFYGTFLPGGALGLVQGPELANLVVAVVLPENWWKVMKKIDFFWLDGLVGSI